jgi:hypothetical protein
MNDQRKKPCKECPFRRKSAPGWLGRDTPEGFITTAMADHPMPCHLEVDYEQKDWRTQAASAPLCAGALIFFANTCKLSRDPERPRLKPDRANVFNNPREFIEHHAYEPTRGTENADQSDWDDPAGDHDV